MLIKALGTYHINLLNGGSFWTRPDETYCVVERTNTRAYAMSNLPGKPVFSANMANKGIRWDFVVDSAEAEWRSWFPIKPVAVMPIDMVLHCPVCGMQHIDAPDHPHYGGQTTRAGFTPRWTNPPHRSHLCANPACGHIWRPADVPTNGVAEIKTKGKNDSPKLDAIDRRRAEEHWRVAHDEYCTNMKDCTSYGGLKPCQHPR